MRISDWSSDVCSSDLFTGFLAVRRSIVTIGVGVAVLFALLAAGGAGTLTRLLEIGDHAETRFELYRRTLDATADSPWLGRSEERRVGKECVRKCGSEGWP